MSLFAKISPPPAGKRWVIADIHGCLLTFRRLVLEGINLQKTDHLYLLGDYIDRGPDSAGVIDFIIQLQTEGYQVFPLRGNHEQDLLEEWRYFNQVKTYQNLQHFVDTLRRHNAQNLLDQRGNLKPKYYQFIRNLPYYYVLPDYYLVHAGFNFKANQPFEDYESMVWSRHLLIRKRKIKALGERRLVVGHTVEELPYIQKRLADHHQIIALDNGCYYGFYYKDQPEVYRGIQVGNLCALDLDHHDLRVQPCID